MEKGENILNGFFDKVIALHEEPELSWEEVSIMAPKLPRGWFELSRFPTFDRIAFTEEYWLSKLELSSPLREEFRGFFEKLEDIGIFLVKESRSSPFEVYMIYALKGDEIHFQGTPPAKVESINNLQKQFETISFPRDYLLFLEIHDGFSKFHDHGIIKVKDMAKSYFTFQEIISTDILLSEDELPILPTSLIPFYEAESLHSYQCFFTDWLVEEGIGNVHYTHALLHNVHYLIEEGGAYTSFLSWLASYLKEDFDV